MTMLALSALLGAGALAQTAETNQPSWMRPDPAALARWKDMRFGMFIHWGPVSLTAQEIGWSRGAQTPVDVYDNLYKQFNPTKFNADEWVKVAKDAGMKYIILTTKHHDGFCLWDTKLTDYNIMNAPFKRDVVKELSAACKKAGLAFGTYYSTCDWHHPDFPFTSPGGNVKREKFDLDSYNRYLLGQLRELITNYGPLLTIWNDVPQMFEGRGVNTIRMVRGLQPDILINDRTGDGGDYGTPEQSVGGFNTERPWESCMTISAHNAWAWGGSNDGVKSLAACLDMLVRGSGGDGNILLNVGPRPDGMIDPEQSARLKEVGDWLAKYGDSIYGTRGGPFKPGAWGASTRKANRIYLHVLKFEGDTLELPAIPAKVMSARVLTGGSVEFKQTGTGITLSVPAASRDAMDTVIALDIDQPALALAPLKVARRLGSLTVGAKATASNVYQQQAAQYGPQAALDDDPESRWATDAATKQCWLEADFGKPVTFSRAVIEECVDYGVRVKSFELQAKDGSGWKTFFKGGAIGKRLEVKFDPVTTDSVRLDIDGENGPTISEFQLFL